MMEGWMDKNNSTKLPLSQSESICKQNLVKNISKIWKNNTLEKAVLPFSKYILPSCINEEENNCKLLILNSI